MHKIIHETFEFDLTPYGISTIEENYWFSDKFYTKYSFPFNFKLNDSLLKVFGSLLDDNAKFIETTYEVKYVLGDKIEKAIFEIESQIDEDIEATFRFGLDEFPNWDVKLADLDLLNTTVPEIYAHAKTHLQNHVPGGIYEYPQIHTNKYEEDETTWATFLDIINNYDPVTLEFYKNTNTEEDFANRNIIQPCPYFLYVLKVGLEMAGYNLKGDITTSPLFQKLLIFADVDVYEKDNNSTNYLINYPNYQYEIEEDYYSYYRLIEDFLEPNTKYRITGNFSLFKYASPDPNSEVAIIYRTNYLFRKLLYGPNNLNQGNLKGTISLEFTTDSNTYQSLILSCLDWRVENPEVLNISIEKIIDNETSLTEIINLNEVNLKKSVPNMTFGEFITLCTNWFNLEREIIGNDVYFNFLENKINYDDAYDLSDKEIKNKKKQPLNSKSFLLKYKDIDSDLYDYEKVFTSKNVTELGEEKVDATTKKIELDALPLPNEYRNGITTAFSFENAGDSKIYAVLYDGLHSETGANTTLDTDLLKIPNIYEVYYKKWLNFRLWSVIYLWTFKIYLEELLKIKKKVFAYGRYMVVKNIDKTQISEDLFEVEIEAETLP